VHSEADRDSLHVRKIGQSVEVGPAAAADSYLNIDAIIRAAKAVGADAVHPGIGFLSESALFAEAVERAGLVFVGPHPETMSRLANKSRAKQEAAQAGVPVIAGSQESWADPAAIARQIRGMSLPVMLKAVAGGGGRGVRVIQSLTQLDEAIESAMREANAAFGKPDLLVEVFVDRPRHIEVQIAGDGAGNVIHIFERECSLQRRFQKIIEEAPATSLQPVLRDAILQAAVRLGRRLNYRGLGTMEFLVKGDAFYFLECNPRLQVEHTVTEEVSGLDLVELQLRIACTGRLPFAQAEVACKGHAIQARVYAEDPNTGFLPSTGRIFAVHFPTRELRVDSGVEAGSEVTPHYDPMIAKLVAHGHDRADALAKLKLGIDHSAVLGVTTNLRFLSLLAAHPAVRQNDIDNRFIDRELPAFQDALAASLDVAAIAAGVWLAHHHPQADGDPWSGHTAWRLGDGLNHASRPPAFMLRQGETRWHVSLGPSAGAVQLSIDGQEVALRLAMALDGSVHATLPGTSMTVKAVVHGDTIYVHGLGGAMQFEVLPYLVDTPENDVQSGRLLSPMMGKIIKVNVRIGDQVKAATPLVILESMKMELSIDAPHDGTVMALNCAPGDIVERDAQLIVIE
jgi:3-methylcrotonyl-CoA carboxylase alpha subunit